jgi:hypothetical protein
MAPPNARTFTVGAIADRFGFVPELREDDNATAGGRIGVGWGADFTLTAVSTTAQSITSGGLLDVTVTVCNQGTQGGAAPLELYFSTDDFLSVIDIYSGSAPMPYLEAGACATVIGMAWAPGPPGIYYVGAIIDGFSGGQELFRDNNTRVGNRVGVSDRSDLYLKSVSTAPSVTPGGMLTVKAMVCNQGTMPDSAPIAVRFSTDATITDADFLGGFLPPISYILPGTCDVIDLYTEKPARPAAPALRHGSCASRRSSRSPSWEAGTSCSRGSSVRRARTSRTSPPSSMSPVSPVR